MAAARNTYMKDYGIDEKRESELLEYCRSQIAERQSIILKAAQQANESVVIPILINLTTGIGYDKILQWYLIPMQRKDFQGYRRKALAVLDAMLRE